MGEREREILGSQLLFRSVNNRLRELEQGDVPTGFFCECGDATCLKRIDLTAEEYENVRADGKRFVVLPGHAFPEVERVVVDTARYAIVEKKYVVNGSEFLGVTAS